MSEQAERERYYCLSLLNTSRKEPRMLSLMQHHCFPRNAISLQPLPQPGRQPWGGRLPCCLGQLSLKSRSCACTPAAREPRVCVCGGRWGGGANNWHFQLFQQKVGSACNKPHKMRENPIMGRRFRGWVAKADDKCCRKDHPLTALHQHACFFLILFLLSQRALA